MAGTCSSNDATWTFDDLYRKWAVNRLESSFLNHNGDPIQLARQIINCYYRSKLGTIYLRRTT